MPTQNKRVLTHLKREGSITALQAMRLYGVMRLAARIDELRRRGHNIVTDMVDHRQGRPARRYARYRLVTAEQKPLPLVSDVRDLLPTGRWTLEPLLNVDPCETCLDKARDEGRDEAEED
jgi:hypothetical protein